MIDVVFVIGIVCCYVGGDDVIGFDWCCFGGSIVDGFDG